MGKMKTAFWRFVARHRLAFLFGTAWYWLLWSVFLLILLPLMGLTAPFWMALYIRNHPELTGYARPLWLWNVLD